MSPATPDCLDAVIPPVPVVNPVTVNIPVVALYVIPPSVFGPRSPVAESNSPTYAVVSVVSATVMAVGVPALSASAAHTKSPEAFVLRIWFSVQSEVGKAYVVAA
jgi:hypothetical protein